MRVKIIKLLLHWMVHNGGNLPSEIVVHPQWVHSVQVFLAELELVIAVRGSLGISEDDVRLGALEDLDGRDRVS